ncbi:uncharacterized protein LOC127035142 isoform X2 [Gopherus flavomarginatus]|uniref:uncharacterized protein LOC127035142 isoform X2 n=1 Tax=Gopherus flavomarginatus TaxID=286002 RepID=UPI0021CBE893|nr:uncharacterized protein LOC127035142 isoform X2 [Gopherus flavomarginatus]
MPRNSREANERRRPSTSTREMEEAFCQLYQEFTQLQDLCAKQAQLLQKLIVKKEPMTDMPISMPIQCTDDGGLVQSERLIFKQQLPKVPSSILSNPTVPTWPNSAVLRDQPRDAHMVSSFDIKYPPNAANASLLSSAKGKANFAIALSSQNHHKPHMGKKAACDTLLKNYMTFPALKVDKEKSTPPPILPELAALNPEDVGSFPSFLDLYEAPQDLQTESTSLQAAEINVPIEIRGPTQPPPKDFIQTLLKNR